MDIELQNINSDSKTGLTSEEAKQRLLKYGENKLKEKKEKKSFRSFFRTI